MRENLKSALIVLLIVTLLSLTAAIWLYDAPITWDSTGPLAATVRALGIVTPPPETIKLTLESSHGEAARPSRIVWTQDGVRLGTQYGTPLLDSLYDWLKEPFRGALGSAGQPVRQPVSAWLDALSDDNIFLDYNTDIPMRTLALWLSSENSVLPDAPVHHLAVIIQEDAVFLWFINQNDRMPYRCSTALTVQDIPRTAPDGLLPCRFGFEDDSFSQTPLVPLFDQRPILPEASFQPVELTLSSTETFLKELHINSDSNNSFPNDEGTITYVDDLRTCRISPWGFIRYSCPPSTSETQGTPAESLDPLQTAEWIEQSRALLATLSPLLRDARFSFSGISVSSENAIVTIAFDYTLSGLPVRLSGDSAPAVLVFTGGQLTSATIRVLSFALGDEPVLLMPETMAYQMLAVQYPDGDFDLRLSYAEQGDGRLVAGWDNH